MHGHPDRMVDHDPEVHVVHANGVADDVLLPKPRSHPELESLGDGIHVRLDPLDLHDIREIEDLAIFIELSLEDTDSSPITLEMDDVVQLLLVAESQTVFDQIRITCFVGHTILLVVIQPAYAKIHFLSISLLSCTIDANNKLSMNPLPGEYYRHYKNKKMYQIIGTALHTETHEDMVVYQAQYDDPELGNQPLFVRPLSMFVENVTYEGQILPRFEKISGEDN